MAEIVKVKRKYSISGLLIKGCDESLGGTVNDVSSDAVDIDSVVMGMCVVYAESDTFRKLAPCTG